MAAKLFAMLKEHGIECELVTEYAKDAVWEHRKQIFQCQPYIFGKQLYKIFRIQNQVDVIVTDSPIILSATYDCEQDIDFKKYILKWFNKFNNLNFYLNRVVPFNPKGRNEKTLEEAKNVDKKLLHFLNNNHITYKKVRGDDIGCKEIFDIIINKINKK